MLSWGPRRVDGLLEHFFGKVHLSVLFKTKQVFFLLDSDRKKEGN